MASWARTGASRCRISWPRRHLQLDELSRSLRDCPGWHHRAVHRHEPAGPRDGARDRLVQRRVLRLSWRAAHRFTGHRRRAALRLPPGGVQELRAGRGRLDGGQRARLSLSVPDRGREAGSQEALELPGSPGHRPAGHHHRARSDDLLASSIAFPSPAVDPAARPPPRGRRRTTNAPEPSLGLDPRMVEAILGTIAAINGQSTTCSWSSRGGDWQYDAAGPGQRRPRSEG